MYLGFEILSGLISSFSSEETETEAEILPSLNLSLTPLVPIGLLFISGYGTRVNCCLVELPSSNAF